MNPLHTGDRWYRGWYVVAAATLITLLTVGLRLGVGPFFIPLAQDFGVGRGTLGAIVALGMFVYGLASPLAGYLANERGTRVTLIAGVLLVTVAIVWSVLAPGIAGFTVAFGVLLSVGLAFTSQVALTPIISRWFVRQRGKALFYLSTGAMAGIAVMTPVLNWGIESFGWRMTLAGFNVFFLVLILPALAFMDDRPPAGADGAPVARSQPQGDSAPLIGLSAAQAARTSYFWRIVIGLFACGYSMSLLGTQAVPMLIDRGFDPTTAAFGVGLIGLAAIAGTMLLGQLADRVARRNLLVLIYVIRGLGFIGLVAAVYTWQLYAVAVVAGLVWAGSVAMSSAILADIYGAGKVGILYGLAFFSHQVGATISAWLGGWGFEHFGSHWVSFGSAAALLLVAGLISARLPASPAQARLPRWFKAAEMPPLPTSAKVVEV